MPRRALRASLGFVRARTYSTDPSRARDTPPRRAAVAAATRRRRASPPPGAPRSAPMTGGGSTETRAFALTETPKMSRMPPSVPKIRHLQVLLYLPRLRARARLRSRSGTWRARSGAGRRVSSARTSWRRSTPTRGTSPRERFNVAPPSLASRVPVPGGASLVPPTLPPILEVAASKAAVELEPGSVAVKVARLAFAAKGAETRSARRRTRKTREVRFLSRVLFPTRSSP